MSDKIPNPKKPKNSKDKKDPSYEVGYGKPPVRTQFKDGQCGNPKGRPKGSKNKPKDISSTLFELIHNEASRIIKVHDGEKSREISILEASIKSIGLKSAKGDHRSQRLLTSLVRDAEKSDFDMRQQVIEIATDFKYRANAEIRNAKQWGLPEPNIIPHPKHIIIDWNTLTVKIFGPLDEIRQQKWDLSVAEKLWHLQMLSKLYQMLAEDREYLNENGDDDFLEQEKKMILDDIEMVEQRIEIFRELIPDDIYIPPSTEEFCRTYLSSHGHEYDEVKQLLSPH